MTSESCIIKGPSVKPSKIRGDQAVKVDLTMKELPKIIENTSSKKTTSLESTVQNDLPKGAIGSLTSKIDSSLYLGNNSKPAPTLGNVSGTSLSSKVSNQAELVQSGKSSLCRGSTSTDVSGESSCSSFSSSVNKPHKANDVNWEAIQAVRTKDGLLDLKHFRLLKKLGCGDIGSVYLSELCGTKCYFAMKVMDKASLAGRKKMLRAQTEREILQSLDHPFLPTLYTHFETETFLSGYGVLSRWRLAYASAEVTREAFF
ncbi:hypothetical protein CASFOL_014078 [Castilleja foliolosa]|uniref:non-specific serine/threonine protein kinase n=1 Tax=Castilleja foliolosa TaxID=1961234 RepID=A0ABD3DMF5_9LAMI